MSDDSIEKTRQFLKNKLYQLKPKLAKKIEEYDKARKTFSELPFVSFWKKPFAPLLKKLLKRKLRRLKREIPALEEKIEHYEQGMVDLEQGKYSSAIPLLQQLAVVTCLGEINLLVRIGIESTECGEILKLIKQFKALSS